jgi:hypothetical protein
LAYPGAKPVAERDRCELKGKPMRSRVQRLRVEAATYTT